ncbi:MAG: zinc ABC transporter substrate-binding protein [Bauldia sp.]|nr:zinc ABC transporter substrate-binding protein [Bauldia sp.]
MHRSPAIGLAGVLMLSAASAALAQPAGPVVVTIKPIHSLVATVMEGVGEPVLLLSGAASPHTYSLRPSDARALASAAVVFWVGPGLEAFLTDSLATLAPRASHVALAQSPGLSLLATREGGVWEEHAHEEGDGDHADEDHDHDHAEDEHEHAEDEHDHAEEEHDHADDHDDHDHAEDEHDHADHDHGPVDMHFWLDPIRAADIADDIAEALAAVDPGNAGAYRANAAALQADLVALDAELAALLEPVHDVPYVVFHDGYQYLEARYGLTGVGSVAINPEIPISAARLRALEAVVEERGARCAFGEPAFNTPIVETIAADTGIRFGVLDYLGVGIAAGPDAYDAILRANAASLVECLGD